MRIISVLAVVLVVLICGLTGLGIWMSGGLQNPGIGQGSSYEIPEVAGALGDVDRLTVMSWNIAWGFGLGSEGSAPLQSAAQMRARFERIEAAVTAHQPDIVLLQEVDFDADRSHGLDQAKAIARAAGLRYVAPATSWSPNYLPFPYWPPSEHWGRIRSGGAILSRFPLSSCKIELLEKPEETPFWYRPFYLFRYIQRCDAQVGGRTVSIYNTHLEAFYPGNRMQQAETLAQRVQADASALKIVGGDFNAVPPESSMLHGYPDEPETDHRADSTLETVRRIPGIVDVVPVEAFRAEEGRFYTFPAHDPNRKLDYIFADGGFRSLDASVPRSAGDASDHLPVVATLQFTAGSRELTLP